MLAILQFITRDAWTFWAVIILISALGQALTSVLKPLVDIARYAMNAAYLRLHPVKSLPPVRKP